MTPFRLIQIIGARPQIIKCAAIHRAVTNDFKGRIDLLTLHTGQHYDLDMSSIFFEELGIAPPDIQLSCGSGNHAAQTAKIMLDCEVEFKKHKPDGVLVYGDTNSTLAASLVAYKMDIPVFHVEAGLRSHNLRMPEECNRIATDHLSSMLFCPTQQSIDELAMEGLFVHADKPSLSRPGVYHAGDVMYDNSLFYSQQLDVERSIQGQQLKGKEIILATCHRPSNTDDPIVFDRILSVLSKIGKEIAPVYLPLHPRVKQHREVIEKHQQSESLIMMGPASFLDMVSLLSRSKAVITDSGGLQKEAFFHERPCVVMREETEWVELVENGNSVLSGNDPTRIEQSIHNVLSIDHTYPKFYGTGQSALAICEKIFNFGPIC